MAHQTKDIYTKYGKQLLSHSALRAHPYAKGTLCNHHLEEISDFLRGLSGRDLSINVADVLEIRRRPDQVFVDAAGGYGSLLIWIYIDDKVYDRIIMMYVVELQD